MRKKIEDANEAITGKWMRKEKPCNHRGHWEVLEKSFISHTFLTSSYDQTKVILLCKNCGYLKGEII